MSVFRSPTTARSKTSSPRSPARRVRTRSVRGQLLLPLKPAGKHGGRREGAGRPKTSKLQPHSARQAFSKHHPLHLTLKLRSGQPSLQRKHAFRCLKQAVQNARRQGLAIIHFSVLSNHLHLIVESADKQTLARQMQSFGISLARRINRLSQGKGAVLLERYHAHILKTPREAKSALAYVLTNEFKHRGSKGRVELDEHSSALLVSDAHWGHLLGRRWTRVVGFPPWDEVEIAENTEHVRAMTQAPTGWMLKVGWMQG